MATKRTSKATKATKNRSKRVPSVKRLEGRAFAAVEGSEYDSLRHKVTIQGAARKYLRGPVIDAELRAATEQRIDGLLRTGSRIWLARPCRLLPAIFDIDSRGQQEGPGKLNE